MAMITATAFSIACFVTMSRDFRSAFTASTSTLAARSTIETISPSTLAIVDASRTLAARSTIETISPSTLAMVDA